MCNNNRTTYKGILVFLLLVYCVVGGGCSNNSPYKGEINIPDIIIQEQSKSFIFAEYNQVVTLLCKVEHSGLLFNYIWYECEDNLKKNSVEVSRGRTFDTTKFVTPIFDKEEIKYYYCEISLLVTPYTTVTSDIFTVAYSNLPLMIINTIDNEEPVCDYVDSPTGWGASIDNATKVPSQIQMKKGCEIIYDSGIYENNVSGATIKIRGNTSAYGKRKSYKIKLQKKADLLQYIREDEENHKDKNWCLINGKTLNTAVGLFVSEIIGFDWTPAFDYVNVVMNGEYRGLYILIESVERSECRINVHKNEGFIVERDPYFWKEEIYFDTPDTYKDVLKYTFKYPDSDNISVESDSYLYIKDFFRKFYYSLPNGNYEDYIDTDSFASWVLVHDLLGTKDYAGSNIFISKYDSGDSKLKMETPWDFDSIYGEEDSWVPIHRFATFVYWDLFRSTNKIFKNAYIEKWNDLSPVFYEDLISKLENLENTRGDAINTSRHLDCIIYNNSYKGIEEEIEEVKSWFVNRIDFINSAITELN